MGKPKGKNFPQKIQQNGKPKVANGILSKPSLKKASILKKKEKKVRFSGPLTSGKSKSAPNGTSNIIVQQLIDSDNENDEPINNPQNKKKNVKSIMKNTASLHSKDHSKQNSSQNKKLLKLIPKGNVSIEDMSESDESEIDVEMDDSEDDSDLAALWDASDSEDMDLPTNMVLSHLFEEADSDDDEEDTERPSSVVIEEVTDAEEKSLPTHALKQLPASSSDTTSSSNKSKSSLKRSSQALQHENESPSAKKTRTDSMKDTPTSQTPKKSPSKNANAKSNQSTTPTQNKEASQADIEGRIRKTIQERLAPYVGKCTPSEFKKLKKKFCAQERKKRAKQEKLYGKSNVHGNLTSSQREELLAISDKRKEELSHRTLYIRPIPSQTNFAAIKKVLPNISGCRIPPKLSTKQSSNHIYKRVRGYAFIEFSSPEEARKQLKALKESNKPIIQSSDAGKASKKLIVQAADEKAVEKRQTKDTKKVPTKRNKIVDFKTLHVSGLPCHVQLGQVTDFMKSTKVVMPIVAEGNLGFCNVTYDRVEDALKFFREKHQRPFHGSKLCITFAVPSSSKGSA